MKKILLSALALSGVIAVNAQSTQPIQPGHITDKALFDDFADGNAFVDGINEYSAEDVNFKGWNDETMAEDTGSGFKGMYWTEAEAKIETNNFVATKNRTGSAIEYTITQTEGAYEPVLVVFGNYSDGGVKTPYTIDLRSDANVSFSIENMSTTEEVRFAVQLQDVNENSLVFEGGVIGNEPNFWQYNIGFDQRGSRTDASIDSDNLAAGESQDFAYDFANAVEGCLVPDPDNNIYDKVLVNGQEGCDVTFDYSKVKAMTFTAVSSTNATAGATPGTGVAACKEFCPGQITDFKFSISNFKMGDQSLVPVFAKSAPSALKVFPNPSNGSVNFSEEVSNVTIFDANGTVVGEEIKASELNTSNYQAGTYMISTDQGNTKLIVE